MNSIQLFLLIRFNWSPNLIIIWLTIRCPLLLWCNKKSPNVVKYNAKGIELNFAEEGGGSYPWDECIADQIKQYGDEETAKKVCGYIKSTYGS